MDVIWKREDGKRCWRHAGRALHERKDGKQCWEHFGRELHKHKDHKWCWRHVRRALHKRKDGPVTPPSVSGNCYFLTIVGQASSFKIVKFLKKKSEVFENFCIAKRAIENFQNKKLKQLVTDRGGEFVNHNFKRLSDDCGYVHIMAPPETPQNNGFSQRENHTILEKTRCLMIQASLPKNYWADAVSTAVLLLNLSPTASRKNQSPHFLWTNTLPKLE
ncbi:hypothetical protein O181_038039 [Austropuccinia psidii MF-1]|uniref:Integrase catalytic domain-containing protein n=1 Tax=Austropuccinia psidii MF-1 TaxID=1389203 RepID=A0A9Q3HD69_9BASI|nr:hypothetical protein [Austropuccinia psidii MF-1]